MPLLIKVVGLTTGPIVELGAGPFSTPYLHWACFDAKRTLVTYENRPEFFDLFRRWAADFHTITLVHDWGTIDLTPPWSVALVDHSPRHRRGIDLARLAHATYVVAHDTQLRKQQHYNYARGLNAFRSNYTYRDRGAYPHTTVLSNKIDLAGFMA